MVSIAAMVALSGVLMLCGADKSQARWFEHRTRRRRRRSSWRACCTLARTPAVEGLVVHIPRAVLGTPGARARPSSWRRQDPRANGPGLVETEVVGDGDLG